MTSFVESFLLGWRLANAAFGFIYGFSVGAAPYIAALALGYLGCGWMERRFTRGGMKKCEREGGE